LNQNIGSRRYILYIDIKEAEKQGKAEQQKAEKRNSEEAEKQKRIKKQSRKVEKQRNKET
jgi:hypothetical protein